VGGCRVSETKGPLGRSSNIELFRKRRVSLQKTYSLSLYRSREHLAASSVLSVLGEARNALGLVIGCSVTRCVAL
jgi:hypothetical protein